MKTMRNAIALMCKGPSASDTSDEQYSLNYECDSEDSLARNEESGDDGREDLTSGEKSLQHAVEVDCVL